MSIFFGLPFLSLYKPSSLPAQTKWLPHFNRFHCIINSSAKKLSITRLGMRMDCFPLKSLLFYKPFIRIENRQWAAFFNFYLPLQIHCSFSGSKKSKKTFHAQPRSCFKSVQSASNASPFVLSLIHYFLSQWEFLPIEWDKQMGSVESSFIPPIKLGRKIKEKYFSSNESAKKIYAAIVNICVENYLTLEKNQNISREKEDEFFKQWRKTNKENSEAFNSFINFFLEKEERWMEGAIEFLNEEGAEKKINEVRLCINQNLQNFLESPLALKAMIHWRKIELLLRAPLDDLDVLSKLDKLDEKKAEEEKLTIVRENFLDYLNNEAFLHQLKDKNDLPTKKALEDFLSNGFFINIFSKEAKKEREKLIPSEKEKREKSIAQIDVYLQSLWDFLHPESQDTPDKKDKNWEEPLSADVDERRNDEVHDNHKNKRALDTGNVSRSKRVVIPDAFRLDAFAETLLKNPNAWKEDAESLLKAVRSKEIMSEAEFNNKYNVALIPDIVDDLNKELSSVQLIEDKSNNFKRIYRPQQEKNRQIFVYEDFFEENLSPFKDYMTDVLLLKEQDVELTLKLCKLNANATINGKKVSKYAFLLDILNFNTISFADISRDGQQFIALVGEKFLESLQMWAQELPLFLSKNHLFLSRDLIESDVHYNMKTGKIFLVSSAIEWRTRDQKSYPAYDALNKTHIKKFIKTFQSKALKNINKTLADAVFENNGEIASQQKQVSLEFGDELSTALQTLETNHLFDEKEILEKKHGAHSFTVKLLSPHKQAKEFTDKPIIDERFENFEVYPFSKTSDFFKNQREWRLYKTNDTNFLKTVYLDALLLSALGKKVILYLTPASNAPRDLQKCQFRLSIDNFSSENHIRLSDMTREQVKILLPSLSLAFNDLKNQLPMLVKSYGLNLIKDLNATDLIFDKKEKKLFFYSGNAFRFEELSFTHPNERLFDLKTNFFNDHLKRDQFLKDFLSNFPQSFLPEQLISLLFIPLEQQFVSVKNEKIKQDLIQEAAKVLWAGMSDAEKIFYFQEFNKEPYLIPQFIVRPEEQNVLFIKLKKEPNHFSLHKVVIGRNNFPCIKELNGFFYDSTRNVWDANIEKGIFYDSIESIWKLIEEEKTYKVFQKFALCKKQVNEMSVNAETDSIEVCYGLPIYIKRKKSSNEFYAVNGLDFREQVRIEKNIKGNWSIKLWNEFLITEAKQRFLFKKYGVLPEQEIVEENLKMINEYGVYQDIGNDNRLIKISGKFYKIIFFQPENEEKFTISFSSFPDKQFNLTKVSNIDPMWDLSIVPSAFSIDEKENRNEIYILKKIFEIGKRESKDLKKFLGLFEIKSMSDFDWTALTVNVLDNINLKIRTLLEKETQKLQDAEATKALLGYLSYHPTASKNLLRGNDFSTFGEIFLKHEDKFMGVSLLKNFPTHLKENSKRSSNEKTVLEVSNNSEVHLYKDRRERLDLKFKRAMIDALCFANAQCKVLLAIVPNIPQYPILVKKGITDFDILLYIENLNGVLLSELYENFPPRILQAIPRSEFLIFFDRLKQYPNDLLNICKTLDLKVSERLNVSDLFYNYKTQNIHLYSCANFISQPFSEDKDDKDIILRRVAEFKTKVFAPLFPEKTEAEEDDYLKKLYLNSHIHNIEKTLLQEYPDLNRNNLKTYIDEQVKFQTKNRALNFFDADFLKEAVEITFSSLSRADREAYFEHRESMNALPEWLKKRGLFHVKQYASLEVGIEGEAVAQTLCFDRDLQCPYVPLKKEGRKYIYYDSKNNAWKFFPNLNSSIRTFRKLQQYASPCNQEAASSVKYIYGLPIKIQEEKGKFYALSHFDSRRIEMESFGNDEWYLNQNFEGSFNNIQTLLFQDGITAENVEEKRLLVSNVDGIYEKGSDQYIKIAGNFYKLKEFKVLEKQSILDEGFFAQIKFYRNENPTYYLNTILERPRLFRETILDDEKLFNFYKELADLDELQRAEKLKCLKDYLLGQDNATFLEKLRYVGRVMMSTIETIVKTYHVRNYVHKYGECPPDMLVDSLVLGAADVALSMLIGLLIPAVPAAQLTSKAAQLTSKIVQNFAANLPSLVGSIIESICGHIEGEDMTVHDLLTIFGVGADLILPSVTKSNIKGLINKINKSSLFEGIHRTFSSMEERILSSTNLLKKSSGELIHRPKFSYMKGKTFIELHPEKNIKKSSRFELSPDLTVELFPRKWVSVYWDKLHQEWEYFDNIIIGKENLNFARKFGIVPEHPQDAKNFLNGQSQFVSLFSSDNPPQSLNVIDFFGELVPFKEGENAKKGKIFDYQSPHEEMEVEFRDGKWELSKFNILSEGEELNALNLTRKKETDGIFIPTEGLAGVHTDAYTGMQYLRASEGYIKIYHCRRDPKIFIFADSPNTIFKITNNAETGALKIETAKNVFIDIEINKKLENIEAINLQLERVFASDMLESPIFSEKNGAQNYIFLQGKIYKVFPFEDPSMFSFEKNKSQIFAFIKKETNELRLVPYASFEIEVTEQLRDFLKRNNITPIELDQQTIQPFKENKLYKNSKRGEFYINLEGKYYPVELQAPSDPGSAFWFKGQLNEEVPQFFTLASLPNNKWELAFKPSLDIDQLGQSIQKGERSALYELPASENKRLPSEQQNKYVKKYFMENEDSDNIPVFGIDNKNKYNFQSYHHYVDAEHLRQAENLVKGMKGFYGESGEIPPAVLKFEFVPGPIEGFTPKNISQKDFQTKPQILSKQLDTEQSKKWDGGLRVAVRMEKIPGKSLAHYVNDIVNKLDEVADNQSLKEELLRLQKFSQQGGFEKSVEFWTDRLTERKIGHTSPHMANIMLNVDDSTVKIGEVSGKGLYFANLEDAFFENDGPRFSQVFSETIGALKKKIPLFKKQIEDYFYLIEKDPIKEVKALKKVEDSLKDHGVQLTSLPYAVRAGKLENDVEISSIANQYGIFYEKVDAKILRESDLFRRREFIKLPLGYAQVKFDPLTQNIQFVQLKERRKSPQFRVILENGQPELILTRPGKKVVTKSDDTLIKNLKFLGCFPERSRRALELVQCQLGRGAETFPAEVSQSVTKKVKPLGKGTDASVRELSAEENALLSVEDQGKYVLKEYKHSPKFDVEKKGLTIVYPDEPSPSKIPRTESLNLNEMDPFKLEPEIVILKKMLRSSKALNQIYGPNSAFIRLNPTSEKGNLYKFSLRLKKLGGETMDKIIAARQAGKLPVKNSDQKPNVKYQKLKTFVENELSKKRERWKSALREKRVVHNDIYPGNIMIDLNKKKVRVHLIDFDDAQCYEPSDVIDGLKERGFHQNDADLDEAFSALEKAVREPPLYFKANDEVMDALEKKKVFLEAKNPKDFDDPDTDGILELAGDSQRRFIKLNDQYVEIRSITFISENEREIVFAAQPESEAPFVRVIFENDERRLVLKKAYDAPFTPPVFPSGRVVIRIETEELPTEVINSFTTRADKEPHVLGEGVYAKIVDLSDEENLALPESQREKYVLKEYLHPQKLDITETRVNFGKANPNEGSAQPEVPIITIFKQQQIDMIENGPLQSVKAYNLIFGNGSACIRLTKTEKANEYLISQRFLKSSGENLQDIIDAQHAGVLNPEKYEQLKFFVEKKWDQESKRWQNLLREKGIVHNDIHAGNILIDLKKNKMDLVDFDEALFIDPHSSINNFEGDYYDFDIVFNKIKKAITEPSISFEGCFPTRKQRGLLPGRCTLLRGAEKFPTEVIQSAPPLHPEEKKQLQLNLGADGNIRELTAAENLLLPEKERGNYVIKEYDSPPTWSASRSRLKIVQLDDAEAEPSHPKISRDEFEDLNIMPSHREKTKGVTRAGVLNASKAFRRLYGDDSAFIRLTLHSFKEDVYEFSMRLKKISGKSMGDIIEDRKTGTFPREKYEQLKTFVEKELPTEIERWKRFLRDKGVVHGDLHPGNIMVDLDAAPNEKIKLIDFDEAKCYEPNSASEEAIEGFKTNDEYLDDALIDLKIATQEPPLYFKATDDVIAALEKKKVFLETKDPQHLDDPDVDGILEIGGPENRFIELNDQYVEIRSIGEPPERDVIFAAQPEGEDAFAKIVFKNDERQVVLKE